MDIPTQEKEIITLGGGCFWCIEAIFHEVRGVEKAESGYSGGWLANPTYHQVCTGTTGHAEVVQITFNPAIISLEELLEIFFTVHDPTTLNRQGPDIGTQYRSVIFYHSEKQREVARQAIKKIEPAKLWSAPIVTELAPFKAFYKAENYHQQYYRLNSSAPYCRFTISPKLVKFREHYRDTLKTSL